MSVIWGEFSLDTSLLELPLDMLLSLVEEDKEDIFDSGIDFINSMRAVWGDWEAWENLSEQERADRMEALQLIVISSVRI